MKKKKAIKEKKELNRVDLEYFDLKSELEYELRVAYGILDRVTEGEYLSKKESIGAAYIIEKAINQFLILDHVFFGRDLSTCSLSDKALKAEVLKFKTLIK